VKHGLKCPTCGGLRISPHRSGAKLAGPYSVRVAICAKCDERIILVTQVATQELAEKVMEEIDNEEGE
jgi:hypothetical protein